MSLPRVFFRPASLVVVAMLAFGLSCAGSLHTMSGAFTTCAEADLGQIVGSSGKTLLDDVASKIKGNSPTLEADLTGIAVTVGIDAVECAIVAVEAALLAQPDTGSAAGSNMTVSAPPPGIARANAWLKTERAKHAGAKS